MDIVNPARAKLVAGELSLGIGIRQGRTVDIARIMQACGFDWLFLDFEHGVLTLDTAAQISVAALDAGITPIVRVPVGAYGMATSMLDCGAFGVVMPHVETAAEAQRLVEEVRFPPQGHRGAGSVVPHFGYRRVPLAEAVPILNRETLVCAMLETPQAIARADEIAAVDGIDIVMIGTNDLALSMGLTGQFDHPEIASSYETVAAACRRHGKWLGSGGIQDAAVVKRYIAAGAQFILGGNDVGLILAAGSQRVAALRGTA